MSRSAERRTGSVVLALATAGCLVTGSASAGPLPQGPATPSTSPSSSPAASASATGPMRPQVQTIRAHSQQMRANVVDLAGVARVSTSPTRIAVTLNSNVLFAKDSAALQPAARARLAEIAAQLAAAGPGSLQITGYTDDLGSAQHGLALSAQRATAVRGALGSALADKSVTVTGKGEANPVVPNTDEASRAKNRRVELVFTKK